MRSPEVWVVDASVSAKWFLTEQYSDNARSLWQRFVAGEIACTAPYFSRHEVLSALVGGVKMGRLTEQQALSELDGYIQTGITLQSDDWLFPSAASFSARFPVSAYDAIYLALADAIGARMVTADRRLREGLAGRIPFLTWIGDVIP